MQCVSVCHISHSENMLHYIEFWWKVDLLYKYWLLMRGMVENYCPLGEIQPLPIIHLGRIVGKGWILLRAQ